MQILFKNYHLSIQKNSLVNVYVVETRKNHCLLKSPVLLLEKYIYTAESVLKWVGKWIVNLFIIVRINNKYGQHLKILINGKLTLPHHSSKRAIELFKQAKQLKENY